jgi:hypothetical protein
MLHLLSMPLLRQLAPPYDTLAQWTKNEIVETQKYRNIQQRQKQQGVIVAMFDKMVVA